jgi:hypothetical protein
VFFYHCEHAWGELGQLGDVDAKGLVARAVSHLVQENEGGGVGAGRDVKIADSGERAGKFRQLVEVRREKAKGARVHREMLGNGASKTEPVISRSAAPELGVRNKGISD